MLGWIALRLELALWRRAGMRPRLWWRDDDAHAPTEPLRRLLDLAEATRTPLALAVVPDLLDPAVVALVNGRPLVTALQHGVDHSNGGEPERRHEFAAETPVREVADSLAAGWGRLAGFTRKAPVYVPPWNHLTLNVSGALVHAGLTSVSGWGRPAGPGQVDVHVDLLRWQPWPRFKGRERLLRQIVKGLRQRRSAGQWLEPLGLLTHHLDHDAAAWRFLEALLLYPPLRTQADWTDINQLLKARV